ncbi:MAG: hypothetical protein HYZ81_11155 [Nitrospinae bacterium]|nr:hypothetical protein [Nitrospinota bacterium]
MRIRGSRIRRRPARFTIWEEGLTRDVYPFILTGDSDGTVDVCAAVPVGYQIVGIYDADGKLAASSQCAQAGVAGDTKIVAFSVEDLQSPPPHLNAKLTIRHKGKKLNDQVDVPGHRQGKDDHHSAQR